MNYSVPKAVPKWNIKGYIVFKILIIKRFISLYGGERGI